MKIFNKVAIVGTGLIGGSLALAIKKRGLSPAVVGVSRSKRTLLLAKKMHAIDSGSQDISIVKDADLVVLATPVCAIIGLAKKISKFIRKGCIVTDVGSTKSEIVAKLSRIFSNYIGSHPLAGLEKAGIINASPNLFKNSLCILTPKKDSNKKALEKIKKLWQCAGANVVFMGADLHDKILSFTSHLPHAVAFSLIDMIPKDYLKFSSSGLKDTTRIAGSDSEIWADIFVSNQKNMLKSIELFQKNLKKIESAIKRKDRRLLNNILERARNKRYNLSNIS